MIRKMSLMMLLSLLFVSLLNAQNEIIEDEEIYDDDASFKMAFAEIGYGTREMTLGIGFRWNYLGLDMNLGGFIDNTPNYIYPSREFPYPKQSKEFIYPRTTLTINANYYYDISDFSIFASVGYYNQTDTALVRSLDEGNTFGIYFAKRGDPAIDASGVCFGLGVEYFIDEKFATGIGYHTKKGAFLQFGYYWY
jgi:hypothetical protein